jgi:gamma-glutamyltranspeptidase/glutathione hydrolase
MVASSQRQATLNALDVLREGGNAIDAALCAAAMLCVTEPHNTGVGGDLFAIVRTADGQLFGLDAAGPAPRGADPGPPALDGPRSVTVPGSVAGWDALAERFGRLGLDRCITPAIEAARRGVVEEFETARAWATAPAAPVELGPAPGFGGRFRFPELAATLEQIATGGPEEFYRGAIADAIVEASWLDHDDLADYRPSWVEPLSHPYRGITVHELPPPTQGIAALEALAILGDEEPTAARAVLAASLALEDALARVRDGADVTDLISARHVNARRLEAARRGGEPGGDTVYLCAVDGDGNAVSLIQSLFGWFGSGVVAGATGVVLQNRGACFTVSGDVEPGRRPYHTLIPGMMTVGTELVGPFGVMGGFIQAQAHVQFVVELVRNGFDPQAALDRGRFRVDGGALALERPLWELADELRALGFEINLAAEREFFGGGQSIIRRDGSLFGGSDSRLDGCALGF